HPLYLHSFPTRRSSDLQYKSPDWSEEQFNICVELGVPIISTAFGCLSPRQMAVAEQQGIKVIVMVTTVEEALQAERSGAAAIVADRKSTRLNSSHVKIS